MPSVTRHAAVALLWQASDATEDGNGFPIYESSPGGDSFYGEGAEYIDAVVPLIVDRVRDFLRMPGVRQAIRDAGMSNAQAGHDLIMTANGHGCGFWDRGLGEAGDVLTKAAKSVGSFDAEFALWGDQADDELHCSDEIAWLMVENEIVFHDDGYDIDAKRCSTCGGVLSPSTMGGYVHLHDSDDTHAPTEEDDDDLGDPRPPENLPYIPRTD